MIAPHGEGAPGNPLSTDISSYRFIVIDDFERTKAELAYVDRLHFIISAARAATKG